MVLPRSVQEVTAESLALAKLVRPKPEILVLGLGSTMQGVPRGVREFVSGQGMQLEALATGAAVSTYNILVGEDRRVMAALLPVA
mmetsp:Transcript_7291/g.20725  ORF Transcript_7291/g.20725 Transcript_7291/m.20725 type:complete len:85 (+) Transcript_7291:3-257(+)